MPAVSFEKTGTAPEGTSWNWNASTQNAILGDDEDWTSYKRAHAWWAGSDPQKKGSYSLPHHRQGDSGLEAVWHGVSNAMARLNQTDLPEDDAHAVFNHLAKHYSQWDKDPPEWDRWVKTWRANVAARQRGRELARVDRTRSEVVVATRAPIVLAERLGGRPTDADLDRINLQARSPLGADEVYVVPSEVSNESIDSYFTRMLPVTLDNFAQGASRGVAFCDSHEHFKLPIGRSFYGEVADTQHDGQPMQATHALAYMLRGLQLSNGLNSDDVIRGLEGGIYADISVGFQPLHFWCSVCGRDMLRDWDCMHWPGQTYEVKKEGERDPQQVLCVADVEANLAEYSTVYDGATPNAMTLKAERELEAGRANQRMVAFVEDHCRVKLRERWRGFGPGRQETPPMADDHAPAGATDDERTGWAQELADALLTRAGRQLSKKNADDLRSLTSDLEAHHTHVSDAIGRINSFIDEKSAPTDSEQGDEDEGEQGATNDEEDEGEGRGMAVDQARAKDNVAKTSKHKEQSDGTDEAPDSEEGASDELGDETGADDRESGGDEEDDRDPEQDPPPGSDDGDGDEDQPEDVEEDDKDDHDPGTSSSKKKRAASAASGADAATGRAAGAGPALTRQQREDLELARQVREQAVQDALEAGVRAHGASFNQELYATVLARASYPEICQMRDDWQQMARALLSPRGRWTTDRQAPGGGYWSDEPTMTGGRQSQARDPNDPSGVGALTTRRPSGAAPERQSRKRGADIRHARPDLYRSSK